MGKLDLVICNALKSKNINVMYNNDTLIQVEVSRKPGHSPLCWQKQRYKVRESLHLPIVALSRNVSGGAQCTGAAEACLHYSILLYYIIL